MLDRINEINRIEKYSSFAEKQSLLSCYPVKNSFKNLKKNKKRVSDKINGINRMEKYIIIQNMSLEGKIVYLGRSLEKTLFFFDTLVSKRGKIYGSRGHSGHRISSEMIRMISMREIDITPIVTARFPLADAVKAIERSTTQLDGKIMICM